ncbi:MAG: hypothetical protein KF841_14185 [Phycisphaerae bacterium]|nr:hypothetical protein [Phycisphaerae bacterium]
MEDKKNKSQPAPEKPADEKAAGTTNAKGTETAAAPAPDSSPAPAVKSPTAPPPVSDTPSGDEQVAQKAKVAGNVYKPGKGLIAASGK